ncbi:hypothetical protein BCR37DRAFT_314458 [Protomyces lactucae-debilis]|uniref:DUF1479-domain-containing protein n=1 Tax=Protomyces lactucae-debilis TaxID=2754530 RepID=A0A1Y2FGU9_PROLT|nr:uncharacterized protein BCR37DRAFT_314458 [Protomyces lactucae-debilis]ORY82506.1 hypothetical protein BCR37DRAFT_314458 [Protomyces lactucae-debilis]
MNAIRTRKVKAVGDISSVFGSLSGVNPDLWRGFDQLKKKIVSEHNADAMQHAYIRAIEACREQVNQLQRKQRIGEAIVPEVNFADLASGQVSSQTRQAIKQIGTVIVRGVMPAEDARNLKRDLQSYCVRNRAGGFPQSNPQVYEVYWSKAQVQARSQPSMLRVQNWLNGFWHGPNDRVDTSVSLTYADRARIRIPGDTSFTLSHHIDGGGIERWQDPTYRKVYQAILDGRWEEYDNLDLTHRIDANMNLHAAPGGCSVLRGYQGWLSLSNSGPGEGSLRINPFPKEAAAYWMLRPFFNDKGEMDLDDPVFHGAVPGKGQEMNTSLHPALQLDSSMLGIPKMHPGDYVAWHADTIHAVDAEHRGSEDASVLYIPTVPLTLPNARYLQTQRADFLTGLAPEDFPSGSREETFPDRATVRDLVEFGGLAGLQSMGLAPLTGKDALAQQANQILFS